MNVESPTSATILLYGCDYGARLVEALLGQKGSWSSLGNQCDEVFEDVSSVTETLCCMFQ
jgi:hypothetical protein